MGRGVAVSVGRRGALPGGVRRAAAVGATRAPRAPAAGGRAAPVAAGAPGAAPARGTTVLTRVGPGAGRPSGEHGDQQPYEANGDQVLHGIPPYCVFDGAGTGGASAGGAGCGWANGICCALAARALLKAPAGTLPPSFQF